MSFWCLQISQKNNEIFVRISALASKKGPNQKNKDTLFFYLRIIWLRTFLFDLFLEARAEILTKISLFFWSIWRHQKDISKFNWPLASPAVFPEIGLWNSFDPFVYAWEPTERFRLFSFSSKAVEQEKRFC